MQFMIDEMTEGRLILRFYTNQKIRLHLKNKIQYVIEFESI